MTSNPGYDDGGPSDSFPLQEGMFFGVVRPDKSNRVDGRTGSYAPQYVRQIQREVGVTADGYFGAVTEEAVRRWQNERGLVADGLVGPQTWEAMGGGGLPGD